MLTGVHFLLTYSCNFECDHCFLHCGPHAQGTFTLDQMRQVFDEIGKIDTVNEVYFEGGESFQYYPLLVEGVRIARSQNLRIGIVTNAYWATAEPDAELWLRPLVDLGIDDLSLSDDAFHQSEDVVNTAQVARRVAERMGFPTGTICITEPAVSRSPSGGSGKGKSVVGGDVVFRGRAVDKLVEGLPRRPWREFDECPHEDLQHLSRVHVDSYGHVHLCQGLSLGNMWQRPLSMLVKDYSHESHPVCAPLIRGGPAQLAQAYDFAVDAGYVDACHLCYEVRKSLVDQFPDHLCPRQVYGLE
ncbi:MAG: radical SAM protein [Candidatus Zixiibacteriota bacterium]|nr:MAG: radical SAM protein [candidate division Zixibacteria bacterium]